MTSLKTSPFSFSRHRRCALAASYSLRHRRVSNGRQPTLTVKLKRKILSTPSRILINLILVFSYLFISCYHQIYMKRHPTRSICDIKCDSHLHTHSVSPRFRTPYLGKGTFSVIVNQTESRAKTPTVDSQFLMPGFPASKLRAEKMVLRSNGMELDNGKGEGHQKHISSEIKRTEKCC